MMDHKWLGECALRKSGLAYSIVRPGALWLTQDGAGGSSGTSFVVTASQGGRAEKGRISKSDLAGVCATCALDFEAALNATFDVAQVEPPVKRPHADDGTRWAGLRRLVSDAEVPVQHVPWLGLFGVEISAPSQGGHPRAEAPGGGLDEQQSQNGAAATDA